MVGREQVLENQILTAHGLHNCPFLNLQPMFGAFRPSHVILGGLLWLVYVIDMGVFNLFFWLGKHRGSYHPLEKPMLDLD